MLCMHRKVLTSSLHFLSFRRVSRGERFRRESMVFVGVVVGALMTARRARLLDRMSLFWRAFVSVVQYAFGYFKV